MSESRLCCPDCGGELQVHEFQRAYAVWYGVACDGKRAHKRDEACRATFYATGATQEAAADRFVQKCEWYGYTRALLEKLQALALQAERRTA